MSITNANYFTFNVDNSIFLTGQTGSGKTEFVRRYMRHIEAAYTPEEMQYIIFDLKRVEFAHDWDGGAKKDYLYRDVIFDPETGLDVLDELAELSKRRSKESTTKPFLFIYIEECDMAILDKERFSESVKTINNNAKKANIKLIYSTSRPAPDAIDKQLLSSFDLIIAGKLPDTADYEYLGIPKPSSLELHDFVVSSTHHAQAQS